jgi:hypothetical protein
MRLHGTCHCNNVEFWLAWEPDPVTINARACTCTFCTRHGAAWTSWPAGTLDIAIREPAMVSRYAFGTKTADFHVCARCGVPPVVTCVIDGNTYAVVNTNTFEGVAAGLVARAPVQHGDELVEERLARRKRNWIGTVRFVDGTGLGPQASGLRPQASGLR